MAGAGSAVTGQRHHAKSWQAGGTGWVDDHYPDSTQILDFFHYKEKLCDFANPPRRAPFPCQRDPFGMGKEPFGQAISSSEKQDSWVAEQSN